MLTPKPVAKITSRLALRTDASALPAILIAPHSQPPEVSTPGFLFGLAHGFMMPGLVGTSSPMSGCTPSRTLASVRCWVLPGDRHSAWWWRGQGLRR